jgi:hypothetical protein
MIEQSRHVPLRSLRWSESEAAAAVEDIVADGLEHVDAERFWPAHPLDEGIRDGTSIALMVRAEQAVSSLPAGR